MRLSKDENYDAKLKVVNQLNDGGIIDKIKASLRAEVVKVLENQKKQQFGGASKYLKDSLLSNNVTKKVISNPDGLIMAEIIRDFMQHYKMEHSLSIFQAEMGLSTDFPMQKFEIERQADITDKDTSKPLMLKLLEKAKFGGGASAAPGVSGSPE